MKIKTILTIIGLTASSMAVGYGLTGNRYQAVFEPHAAKCWSATKEATKERASLSIPSKITPLSSGRVVIEFPYVNAFGAKLKGSARCDFNDQRWVWDGPNLEAINVNGQSVPMVDVMFLNRTVR